MNEADQADKDYDNYCDMTTNYANSITGPWTLTNNQQRADFYQQCDKYLERFDQFPPENLYLTLWIKAQKEGDQL